MVESIAELRRRVQIPVRRYNDIAGVLVGDWVSIHLTRLFIAFRISPTVATLGMPLFGLSGSLLVAASDRLAPLGFFLVFLYYICDCVDGEVARYWKREKIIWGFHEFFFHLYVKGCFFLCVGWAGVRTTGSPWVWPFAFAALLATFWLKFLRDIPLAMVGRFALTRSPRDAAWMTEQLDLQAQDTSPEDAENTEATEDTEFTEGPGPRETRYDEAWPDFGGPLATLRAIATNFDLSLVFFTVVALLDRRFGSVEIFGAPWNLQTILLAFYGIALPLQFIDTYATWVREGRFFREARDVLRGADRYHIRPSADPGRRGGGAGPSPSDSSR